MGSIPGSGRSAGEGHGNPLQYSCLENPMVRGAWKTTDLWVVESDVTEITQPAHKWHKVKLQKAVGTCKQLHTHITQQLLRDDENEERTLFLEKLKGSVECPQHLEKNLVCFQESKNVYTITQVFVFLLPTLSIYQALLVVTDALSHLFLFFWLFSSLINPLF